MIEVRDYSFRYGDIDVLSGISFSLEPGDTLGIVGESGSGKTTLLRSIFGLVRGQARGSVSFHGRSVISRGRIRYTREERRRTGFVAQNPDDALESQWTLREIWNEPLRIHGKHTGRKNDETPSDRMEALCRELRLPSEFLEAPLSMMSGGQKQRAAIGRALILQPELLLLDEPFSALDVGVQAGILNLLRDSLAHRSCILVSHDLAAVSFLCNRVMVLYGGRVVESGPLPQIFQEPRAPYTQELVRSAENPEAGRARENGLPLR